MSNHETLKDDAIPRFEPWLGVMASSFVPAAAAIFVPPSVLVPLIALTVLLFATSLVMLRRQSTRQRDSGSTLAPESMEAS